MVVPCLVSLFELHGSLMRPYVDAIVAEIAPQISLNLRVIDFALVVFIFEQGRDFDRAGE